jgi:hypothetical protein
MGEYVDVGLKDHFYLLRNEGEEVGIVNRRRRKIYRIIPIRFDREVPPAFSTVHVKSHNALLCKVSGAGASVTMRFGGGVRKISIVSLTP